MVCYKNKLSKTLSTNIRGSLPYIQRDRRYLVDEINCIRNANISPINVDIKGKLAECCSRPDVSIKFFKYVLENTLTAK